ncbi:MULTISPECIES: 3-oxoadipate enol-lactonase [Alphaproteobacteria]|uniref:3-oxoadipate enol-lactonase n=2 Tax=Alphaproteobacteria TaxID=28211 RepID=A0A512HIV6_9HYPH|nr:MULTISPECIES: 3-oxoadipate enol-lactonase [Alphaproteobacteria]GEO85367.1 3-oxoadipate enol-lactonase [Ciceribacter naphthalenivorans]GLR21006.1 3-oxoadipate enol-lactonase [Ciceribacter naphthalenivorans]GLT03862.1 3-oxoadipate enol-lactonase [Sphingomonas psychrolutea]
MAFATINDIPVHYELLGEPDAKNLVVFSNSLGTDFRIWLPLFDELSEDISVLLYDSRGHGLTGGADKPFGMADLVDDLIALVEHVGIKRAVFCGLSVGGLICQGVWQKRPDMVKKLVLCDTAAKIGAPDAWNARIDAIAKDGLESIADNVMERWFTADFHQERADDLAGYRLMMSRQAVAGYSSTCAAIRDTDFTNALATISVPVLCVVGDQDGSTPPELVKATASAIPGARFETIEGCGHIPCVEQPEQLAALLQPFLKKA